MKIKKVIVDELPEDCVDCGKIDIPWHPDSDSIGSCIFTGHEVERRYERNSDCPLQLEQTCGNCKSFEKYKGVNLCNNDFCGLVGEIQEVDYCSRWEAKECSS